MTSLQWLVADTLTGQLVGRFEPASWTFEDPLTGSAKGDVTIPVPTHEDRDVEMQRVAQLRDWVTPMTRQVVVRDERKRWWFGGPILAPAEYDSKGTVKVSFGDWRSWFYAAPIRPVSDTVRQDYIKIGGSAIEQMTAIKDLAALALATTGAPRMIIDTMVASGINREVTFRMFKIVGEALDNLARRERGPDWWTYITDDPIDPQKVVAHVTAKYPERRVTTSNLSLFQRLFHKQDVGSNILTYKLPTPPPPPARVYGVGPTPPPAEEWATAENPGLQDGTRMAWDEVWRLPEGVTSGASAFEHTLARLNAHTEVAGVADLTIDPAITDLMDWGPGDRCRLLIDNGWDLVDKDDARILSRTMTGRADVVTTVALQVNLGIDDDVSVDEPEVDDGS